MAFLNWLEMLPLSVWVHESPSVWAQPTVMTLHTMGMGVLVGASWVLDLRLLGISRNMPLSAFRWVFRAVAISLAVNLVTGVLLFVARATLWGTALPFCSRSSWSSPARRRCCRSALTCCKATRSSATSAAGRKCSPRSLDRRVGRPPITAGRLLAYTVAG